MSLDVETLIHRIVSGSYILNIDNNNYIIQSPDLELRSRARSIYNSIIEDNKFETDFWISDHQINTLLLFNGIWNDSMQKQLDDQIKLLEQSKIDLFLNYSNDKQRYQLKDNIISINSYINKLYEKKYAFNFLSLDFYAKTIENQFLVLNMVYYDNNEQVFDKDSEKIDSGLFSKLIEEIQKNSIDMTMMKTIVKSNQWRNYWTACKDNLIRQHLNKWTEEQITLVNLSKTYDSIREHPESPSEEIINDDDALDGWMIYQNNKIEKEKKKQKLEEKHGLNNKKGDEIFILTDSVEETKEIFNLNDPTNKAKINQIKKLANTTDTEVKWAEIPFVKQELQQQYQTLSNRKG